MVEKQGGPPRFEHVRFGAVVALIALTVVVTRDAGGVYPLCAVLLVVLGWHGPWPPRR